MLNQVQSSAPRPAEISWGGGAKAKPHDAPVTDPRIPKREGGMSSSSSFANA